MNYNKETYTYPSHNGLDTITSYIYAPKSPIKAILQISHGMCEYVERYEDFANFLTSQGILFCGNDHLGHGKSIASPDQLGYFRGDKGWQHLYEDVFALTQNMQKRYPEHPYFLLGHSMGSFVARAYLSHYGNHLDGAIIMGTSGPNPLGKVGIKLATAIANQKDYAYRSPFITDLAFKGYNKKIANQKYEHDWLSRDTEIVAKYEKDPYCNFKFTLNGYLNLFKMLDSISSKTWASTVSPKLPILVTAGAEDPVGNFSKGTQTVYKRLQQAGGKDLSLKLYPGARHEIINETNRQEVYQDLVNWLEQHI